MSTHARLSPSGSEGWVNCSQWQHDSKGSSFAFYGTLGHAVAAAVLLGGVDANQFLGQTLVEDQWVPAELGAVQVDIDLLALVHHYVEYVKGFDLTHTRLVEVAVPIDHLTGEAGATGTADCILMSHDGEELVVVDFKTGRGVEVEAEQNSQLMMYASGALEYVKLIGFIPTTVRIVIHQPRVSLTPSEWTCTVADLVAFGARVQAAAAAYGTGPATPGPGQCRWCAAKATCPALRGEVLWFTQMDVAEPDDFKDNEPLLPNPRNAEWLAACLSRLELIEDWCSAVRTEAARQLGDGREVPGFKLVAGRRGPRAWTDEAAVTELFKSFRLTRDEMFDLKLISPSSAEKLLKSEPKRWAKAQALITQSEGKPTVAPASDKRPALVVTPCASQFHDETGADLA